jgi:hypothetical protein
MQMIGLVELLKYIFTLYISNQRSIHDIAILTYVNRLSITNFHIYHENIETIIHKYIIHKFLWF